MNTCRICLSGEVSKSLKDVETVDKSGLKTYIEILMFCVGIEVSEHSTLSNRLCVECFKKISTYYDFKTLALTSDAFLRSLEPEICVKDEIIIEEFLDDDEFNLNDFIDIPDIGIPEEKEDHLKLDSDEDEVLSIVKKSTEDVQNDTKEDIQYGQYDSKEDEGNNIKEVIKKVPRKRVKGVKQVKTNMNKKNVKKKDEIKSRSPGICEQCGKFVQNLSLHANTHIPKEQRNRYQCKFCDKTFITTAARRTHEKIKHKGQKKHCDICGKQVTELRSHKLRVHQRELLPYPCLVCGKGCLSPFELQCHMKIHTKDHAFECDVCHARFRSKYVMLRHKRSVHDKERPHVCQFCAKSYFKKDALKDHLRTHTDERPYKCEECGKAFRSHDILKNHRAIHSDDKPYQCPHCDMKFARNQYLISHKQTHTTEKKFPCYYCGVRFRRAYDRDKHETTVHKNTHGVNKKKKSDVCIVDNEGSNVSEDTS